MTGHGCLALLEVEGPRGGDPYSVRSLAKSGPQLPSPDAPATRWLHTDWAVEVPVRGGLVLR